MCNCHHVQCGRIQKCVSVIMFSAGVSKNVALSSFSARACQKVCRYDHFQCWGVQKYGTVMIFSTNAPKTVQLSSVSALRCLKVCNSHYSRRGRARARVRLHVSSLFTAPRTRPAKTLFGKLITY
jgi:hypothetical protein